MSEVTADAQAPGEPVVAVRGSRIVGFLRRAGDFIVTQSFSSLTRRIVVLNVAGLFALVIGVLYLSQFRAGLIDARVQSLLVQGEIIASAIAASATGEKFIDAESGNIVIAIPGASRRRARRPRRTPRP